MLLSRTTYCSIAPFRSDLPFKISPSIIEWKFSHLPRASLQRCHSKVRSQNEAKWVQNWEFSICFSSKIRENCPFCDRQPWSVKILTTDCKETPLSFQIFLRELLYQQPYMSFDWLLLTICSQNWFIHGVLSVKYWSRDMVWLRAERICPDLSANSRTRTNEVPMNDRWSEAIA